MSFHGLKNLSIKWKLSLSLIMTGLGLVVIYIFIAKGVFEADKISYVFESQSSRLSSLKREIDGRFDQVLLNSRSLLATLDDNAQMPLAAQELFKDNKLILGIELWDETERKSIFRLEKASGVLPVAGSVDEKTSAAEVKLIPVSEHKFLLTFRPYKNAQNMLLARVLMDSGDFLPSTDVRQPVLIVQDNKMIASVGTTSFKSLMIKSMIEKMGADGVERTTLWKYGSQTFLVSSAETSVGGLRVLAFTPEDEALGALKTLFYRSLVFLAFSTFGLIVISLLLARSLTSNIRILTSAADEIGRGNFDKAPKIDSNDEMGVLAGAFLKMSQEIKRLLVETRDKARMESELKTAKLVQESLFPVSNNFECGQLEIDGLMLTSTECGGDWWFYFTRGNDVYIAIADATGHGTPAALITAAARSVFSRLENEDLSLSEMMKAWDFAVSSCSRQRVFMTGMLFKINTETGIGQYLSAGHEAPYIFDESADGYSCHFMELDVHPALGEGMGDAPLAEQDFVLKPNSSLVLYTDGLFAVESADGKKLSERRFTKLVSAAIEFSPSAEKVTQLILRTFEDHRKGAPLPDDVTLVSVRRKGPIREAALTDESFALFYEPQK